VYGVNAYGALYHGVARLYQSSYPTNIFFVVYATNDAKLCVSWNALDGSDMAFV